MAFPPEIPTRAISVGGAAVLESSTLLKVQVTVTASKSLVWDATGFRYERMSVTDTSELGSELVIPLPRTDVQWWRDAKTGEIIDVSAPGAYTHRYTATVRFLDADNRPVAVSPVTLGPFVVPAGDGPIDLDKTVPASTVAGDTVNVPDWWGQLVAEAQAAADRAAQSMIDSDQFIADQIATPGTATATQLSATIGDDRAVAPLTDESYGPRFVKTGVEEVFLCTDGIENVVAWTPIAGGLPVSTMRPFVNVMSEDSSQKKFQFRTVRFHLWVD